MNPFPKKRGEKNDVRMVAIWILAWCSMGFASIVYHMVNGPFSYITKYHIYTRGGKIKLIYKKLETIFIVQNLNLP